MPSHKSLVGFTLLVQSAVGSVWCTGLVLLLNGSSFRHERNAIVALLFVLAGLTSSIAHLGRPGVCFYAVRNLRRSWLSREIVATGVFAGILAATALAGARPGPLSAWLVLPGSAAGASVLYVMARAYRLRTVPSWNHAGTFLDFLGSALLLGGMQFTIAASAAAPDFGADFPRNVGLLAALVGFVIKVQAQGANRSQPAKTALFSFSQPVLQGAGIVLWAAAVMLKESAGAQWAFLSVAAAFLAVGEVIGRVRFYKGYRSAGL